MGVGHMRVARSCSSARASFLVFLSAFLLMVCSMLIAAPNAAAQSTGGRIRGTVTDNSGAAVAGAKVTLINEATNKTREAETDASGEYLFLEIPVGSYEIDVTVAGFKKYVRKGIPLNLDQIAGVDVALQVGGATETVEVSGAPPVIDTTTTSLGAVMTERSVTELPLSTRNTYQLLQLQPGVQSQLGADLFAGSDNPGVVSVNGGRGRSNNYTVNGGDGNDLFINGPAIQPSPDAIAEFRVLTNTFDAEYGRNSGSVINVVTKSGSNEVHGDFYEFIRNDVLNAKGFFDPTVPDYKQNQFGATIGAPIKKDKTFIFGSYEGNRLRQGIPSGNVTLPSAAEAAGNFGAAGGGGAANLTGAVTDPTFATALANRNTGGGQTCQQAVTAAGGAPIAAGTAYSSIFTNGVVPTACFDPTALALYNKYVAPLGVGTIQTLPKESDRSDQFTVRLDHAISTKQQLSIYYYFNDDDGAPPFSNFQAAGANVPGFGAINTTRVQQWNIAHTWTLGSSAVNEFRFSYLREGEINLNHPSNLLPSLHDACGAAIAAANCFADPGTPAAGITTNIPGREGVPFVNVSGGFAIGNNSEGELPQVGNTFQWSDNYSKILGKHSTKFGVDVRRQRFDQFTYFNINGSFSFQTAGTENDLGYPNGYADYFLGVPTTYTQGAAQAENDRTTSLYLFAQDSWKIKSNVTLNYGLRWELNTPYSDVKNRLQTFRPGQATTQYPCFLSQANEAALGASSQDCGENSPNNAYFPLGLVFPNDQGVPRGLTTTYYKAFAPRIGLAYSPSWTEGWLAKLTGGPGKSTIRGGYGIFYNPIEQLVLAQFSAEPPFGGSIDLSNPNFSTPFLLQNGTQNPNVFGPVLNQTPNTPCFQPGGPNGCVDWSAFRPILLFGEFDPHLKTQYADQYNLTIERQLTKSTVLRMSYVGTQGHHLLGVHDENAGNIQTCLGLMNLANANANAVLSAPLAAGGVQTSCGPFSADTSYFIPGGTVIPAGISALPPEPFHVPSINCTGLVLPYTGTPGGNPGCVPAGIVPAGGITLV